METYTAMRHFADSWGLLAMTLFFLAVVLFTLRPGARKAADARADRSAAIRAVFAEMESAGAEMARAAGGHAADALMYQRAWPK